MSYTREKPPVSNPLLKLSIGSAISNPISDDIFLELEGKKNLHLTIIFIIIDILLTLLIILQSYNFFMDDFKGNILTFILHSFCVIAILSSIIIIYYLHKYIIALITRFGYIIIGGLYFLVILVIKIVNIIMKLLSDDTTEENIELLDIIFLFVHFLTVIPRIFAFFLIKKYIIKLKKIRDIHMVTEHDNFVEKIADRIEKGYIRWSNPNASYIMDNEKDNNNNVKKYFDKKEEDEDLNINNEEENDDSIGLEINGEKKKLKYNDNNNNKEKEFIFDKKDENIL